MSITDFTFNNTHFQVKMVKKFKICFFFSIFQHGLQPCPINRQIDWTRFHWIWRQKKFFGNFCFFFSLQEYVLKMKYLKFLTRHYSGASVSEVPNE